MDPTVGLPLQFTIETALLTSAGLVVAWAALRRQWWAMASATAIGIAQALHAARSLASEDDMWLIVLRLAGIAGLAITTLRTETRRGLFGTALALLTVGTLWGALAGGAAEDFAIAPHVLLLAGALALLVWVWFATQVSVRLRVIAAFVSVLAMAVVVAGGAIARVAALDARSDVYGQLDLQAAALSGGVSTIGDALSRKAASYAFTIGASDPGPRALDGVPLRRTYEWAAFIARDGKPIANKTGAGATLPYTQSELLALAVTKEARRGADTVSFSTTVEPDGLIIVAAAPVYRPTATRSPSDLRGALVLGHTVPTSELQDVALGDAALALRGERHFVSNDGRIPADFPAPVQDAQLQTIDVREEKWFASVGTLPNGNVHAIVAAPDDAVVDATSELVRAFLVAILGAAMLAVIGALWLSARITRPMLELADDAERVKADFLSSVSHELRTPLTPIRGYTELLRRGVPARSRTGYLDEIGNATQRLERIVSLLVDVAAMDAGRYQIAEENVSVRELFEAAKERWTDRKRPAQIEISLPKADVAVRADARAISRVLDELIDNAFKFAPERSPVELAARRAGRAVEISVSDQGPGIDPERLAALKAPFATGERGGDTKRYGGLGLGLSFVEGVLRAHRSRLTIDSQPGEGTRCILTLPAAGSVTAMPARTGRGDPPSKKRASPGR